VRLRGCVAIELFVGALVATAISGAAIWGVAELRGALAGKTAGGRDLAGGERTAYASDGREVADREANAVSGWESASGPASGSAPASGSEPVKLAAAAISGEILPVSDEGTADPPPIAVPAWTGRFLGKSDEELLAPFLDSPVKAVKLNRGGSSLSLRIDFESGGRAACKPNQVHMHSQPRREIAAYRINRLLGLSSVSPAIGRRFRVAELADRFKVDARKDRARFMAELLPEREGSGTVIGELTWWISELAPAMIDNFEIDTVDGVVTWKRYLTAGNDIPPESRSIAGQVSDLLLFDFIINNSDRWSGGNIKSSLGGTVLVFLDNTLSFGGDPNGHNRVRTYLQRSQRFSRRLVDRLRQLDQHMLEEALTRDIDPFPLLLEKYELRAVLKRRDVAIRYIDDLIAQHGEDAVLWFP
jgi:hypothetical protein